MDRVPADQIASILKERLAQDKSAFLHVVSRSMEPLLRVGDQVEVRRIRLMAVTRLSLLVLQAPGALYCHRFWGIVNDADLIYLATRGDRSLSFDPLWEPEQLLGRIVGWRRGDHYFSLRGPAGRQLNEQLGLLAQNELKLFARLYGTPRLAQLPDSGRPGINFNQVDRSRFVTFLLRRLYKGRAQFFTRIYLPRMRS